MPCHDLALHAERPDTGRSQERVQEHLPRRNKERKEINNGTVGLVRQRRCTHAAARDTALLRRAGAALCLRFRDRGKSGGQSLRRFRPLAQGKDGEIGLMQVKMDVVRDWAKARGMKTPRRTDVFDPYVNIEIGTWYFARAFRKWSRSSHALLLALGEYNAGPGRVRRWIRQCGGDRERAISHSASSRYVRAIRDKYLAYTVQYAASIASSGTERSNTPPSGLSEGSRL